MMVRALLSSSTFPIRTDDGLPRFVFDLAEALADHCEVNVLVPGAPGVLEVEQMGRIDVRRFTYFYPRNLQKLAYGHGIPVNLRSSFLAKLQLAPYLIAQVRATRSLVQERQIDIVNSHWMIPQGLSTAIARGKGSRFRHVVTLHSGDAYMLRRLPFGRSLARFIMARTDATFVVSSNVLKVLDEILGWPSGASIQPVGVHVDLFRRKDDLMPAPSRFPGGYLLFVGRLHEIKGIQFLLRAMPKVLRSQPDLGLILIGYGPYLQELKREVGRLGLEQKVDFPGQMPHREIARYLHGCQAVVVPSITERDGRTEGTPSVVIEALAAGTRIIASNVGGIRDIIDHGRNGWLCSPRDPEDLGEKILIAIESPPQSDVVSAAVETAESFDWPVVATRYADTFAQILRLSPSHDGPR